MRIRFRCIVAFSLAHTVVVDQSTSASIWADERTAILYLTDTFLPARGWVVNTSAGTSGAVKRGLAMPSYDLYNSNATAYSYNWLTVPTASTVFASTYLAIYEDANYTTVPGDKMTDTTNSITWYFKPTGGANTANWKFWTSDEDASLFFVTRANKVILWGCKRHDIFMDSNADYPESSSADQWRTHYYPPCPQVIAGNLPNATNTSSTEWTVYFNQIVKYAEPSAYSYMRNFSISNQDREIGYIDYNDIRQSVPVQSERPTSPGFWSLPSTSTGVPLYKVTDGTDWYVTTSAPTNNGLAFYCGTTEPDLS